MELLSKDLEKHSENLEWMCKRFGMTKPAADAMEFADRARELERINAQQAQELAKLKEAA